ncbi:MAG TPA: glycosyltransferase family 39 protein [Solirubrobacteraceae bacterium]|nr:glycosyltransferase family 39 protein [Solirubrobacteraceae bacterium]
MLLQARTGAPPEARIGSLAAVRRPSGETIALVALVLLAAALRFSTLTDQSYWLDEAQAAHELGLSLPSMLGAWSAAEWNPPLYLLVAWPWAHVLGTGPGALRSLSALLGVGLVVLVYLCGRELVSGAAGLVAAALAAVDPFTIWYSQEAREYSLLLVLCAASLLSFARAHRAGARRDLLWWAVLSALAILTQYFAGFLVFAEGALLLRRSRSRAALAACAAQVAVLVPFVPHLLPRLRQPALFITSVPLGRRIQEVPVAFALGPLDNSRGASWGLLGAAALAAIVIALLVAGAGERELRGAALAAALAGFVLVAPLALALVGHDDYIARGLMPAWPPLAVVVGAAATAARARVPGAALAAVLVAAMAWGEAKVQSDPLYQRPNWRGVAAALGAQEGTRAIAAYPGQFATGPLSWYLPRVPWAGPGGRTPAGPVTVSELDVIANAAGPPPAPPAAARVIAAPVVDGYQIVRYALAAPVRGDAGALAALAERLFPVPGLAPQVIVQRAAPR